VSHYRTDPTPKWLELYLGWVITGPDRPHLSRKDNDYKAADAVVCFGLFSSVSIIVNLKHRIDAARARKDEQ